MREAGGEGEEVGAARPGRWRHVWRVRGSSGRGAVQCGKVVCCEVSFGKSSTGWSRQAGRRRTFAAAAAAADVVVVAEVAALLLSRVSQR